MQMKYSYFPMPELRQDRFLAKLKALKGEYSEYAEILDFVIDRITQGQCDQVQQKIQQMQKDNW